MATASLLFEFDDRNQSPLHLACQHNHPDSVTVLLQFLSAQSAAGTATASFCSEYLHYYDRVSRLSGCPFDPCSSVSLSGQNGSTCLHLAAAQNSLRVVQLLLREYKQWISVEVLDRVLPASFSSLPPPLPRPHIAQQGNTPLHIAVSRGHLEAASLLIESFDANKFALNSVRLPLSLPSHHKRPREESRLSTSPALLAAEDLSNIWSNLRWRSARRRLRDSHLCT
jgi:ankyrin repeat protein